MLQDSKHILVIAPPNASFDQYISIYLIVTSLQKELNKTVHVGGKIPEKFANSFPLTNTKLISKLAPKKYVLEFKSQKNQVKNIQWNQEGENLNFYISMENGEFNDKSSNLKTIGADYGTIILIGVNDINQLGTLYSNSKEIFAQTKIVSVGSNLRSQELKVQSETDEKHSSTAEDAYYFLQRNGIKFDAEKSSMVLAGIFDATKNFKKKIKDPKTFVNCAELIRRGGSNEKANELLTKVKDSSDKQSTKSQNTASNVSEQPFAQRNERN
jgi:hypothetical protein